MPSFEEMTALYDNYHRSSSAVTIVFFWSISCHQCVHVFNVARYLSEYYKDINLIAVHMPLSEADKNPQEIKQKYKGMYVKAPLYLDQDYLLSKRFGNRFVPSLYVFDENGLRYYQGAATNERFIIHHIEKIVKK